MSASLVRKQGRKRVVSSALTENEEKAYELRGAGASYREIAKALGFRSADSALQCVKRAIAKTQFESAAEALLMDLANLDDWAKRCTHRLRTTGDLNQIDRLLRIQEKKHQLLGVDSTTLSEKMGQKKTAGGATIVVSPSEVGFIQGLMASVGVDPESAEAQKFLAGAKVRDAQKELPAGSPEPAPIRRAGRKRLVVKKKRSAEVVDTLPRTEEVPLDTPHVPVAEIKVPIVVGDLYAQGQAPILRETTI